MFDATGEGIKIMHESKKKSIDHREALLQSYAANPMQAVEDVLELAREANELEDRVKELEEYRDRLAHEAAYLAGAYPVLDCRICDYSEFCPRNETRIEPDFDICKAAILNICKPDMKEAEE